MLIKDSSIVDCIHQSAVMLTEYQNVEVDMETKYNSVSMQEFPEVSEEPIGGKSTKRDKRLWENIATKSDLNLKHLICLVEHPSRHAPCIPVWLQQMDFLTECIYVWIWKS